MRVKGSATMIPMKNEIFTVFGNQIYGFMISFLLNETLLSC